MKKQYQTILLDLDDTLIDFKESEHRGLKTVYQQFIPKHISYHDYATHYRTINKDLWLKVDLGTYRPTEVAVLRFQYLFEKLNIQQDIIDASLCYEHAISEEVCWLPNTEQALLTLSQNYTLGVITNGLSIAQKRKAKLMNLSSWADCYLISEDVGLAKPNPDIFTMAMRQLNANPTTTLMVGDNLESDFQGAINSGIDFCWVTYQHKNNLPTPNNQPTYAVNTIAELLHILESEQTYSNEA